MKSILLIHHYGGLGGAGLSFLHLVKSIDKEKYKLTVICPASPPDMAELLKSENCNVITMEHSPVIFPHYSGGIRHAWSLRSLINILKIFNDKSLMKKVIDKINPDIIAVNSMTLVWIGALYKKSDKNLICFHRETYQKGLFGIRTKLIKKALSNWFNVLVFISEFDKVETGETKAKKIVIYDKVEVDKYSNITKESAKEKLGLDIKSKYILFLGGNSKLKGAHVVLEAMNFIENENVELLFIGMGNKRLSAFRRLGYQRKLQKLIKAPNIKTYQSTTTPELFYKACDVIVFPSTKGHQARPIYEAGISKIPIIISDFENTKEFAENNLTAITFRRNNPRDLALKIQQVLNGNNVDLVNNLIKNNYSRSKEAHSIYLLGNELNDLFEL